MVNFTEDVLLYQENKDERIIGKIQKGVIPLIYGMLAKYGMAKYPLVIREDIVENCRTYKLMAAIETYDPTRGASFVTHYCWYLRSECAWKKRYYLRRAIFEFGPSEQDVVRTQKTEVCDFTDESILEEAEEILRESDEGCALRINNYFGEAGVLFESIPHCVATANWQSYVYAKRYLAELFDLR